MRTPPRGWGPSLLQSACDFWEPVGTLTAGLAPPEWGFLEVPPGAGRGAPGGRQDPNFHPRGPGRVGMAAALRLYPTPPTDPILSWAEVTREKFCGPELALSWGGGRGDDHQRGGSGRGRGSTWLLRQPGGRRLGGFLVLRGRSLLLRDLYPAGRQARRRLAPAVSVRQVWPLGREAPGASPRPSVSRVQRVPTPIAQIAVPTSRLSDSAGLGGA